MASTKKNDGMAAFNADRDENGQNMSDAASDRADPRSLQAELKSDPGGEAETARIASGQPIDDATDATEAETPTENIAHISDASLPTRAEAAAAIERATSGLGKE